MSKSLIIVESPTKAKTIAKFLGKNYEIIASYGHVRDLPNNAAEIPAEVKKEKWARLGIDIEANFEPLYIIPEDKKKRVTELKKLLKDASDIYLATDEDREGESISWHLLEVLAPKIPVKRLVFHEITKTAIEAALASPRSIDLNLVKAQETRRIIDRLFGYTVSPLLWKKVAPRLSAGRVQSVAMRLLAEREIERMRFRSGSYWDLAGVFATKDSGKSAVAFDADLTHVDGKRIASGRDFDPSTGQLSTAAGKEVALLDEKSATALREEIVSLAAKVSEVEEKPFTQKPSPPFTTSTLQQEGGRKLFFSAKRTMQVAQTLYENGFITYMRTDSTNLSAEAISGARTLIEKEFGKEFLPAEPRLYKTKVKNAQEAHEAIRPAGSTFIHPTEVREKLGGEAFRLYELIWKRTIASQMKDAQGMRVSVGITVGRARFRASGRTISFPGFLRAYVEGADDPEADLADKERILPPMAVGDGVTTKEITTHGHETQPPARYTEGTLIKQLETLGIGRPSTWATIVDVVMQRTYAFKKGTALVPTFLALALTELMRRYFSNVVDYEYTANLEEDLDRISRGEADNLLYLKDFYLGSRPGLQGLVARGEEVIDPREVCGIPLGKNAEGVDIEVRIGRYGPFLTNGETRASLATDLPPDELTIERAQVLLEEAKRGPESLGAHPVSAKPIYLKAGRFGPYVQEGEASDSDKPKMASLLAGMAPTSVTLEIAVQLLSLPRNLGVFADNGGEIEVHNGRYGPYVKAGSETRTLTDGLSPLDITLDQATTLLRSPKLRGRAARGSVAPLASLGAHPETGKELSVKQGRFGPYVTDGEINASLPRGMTPEELSVQEAVNLLEARAAKIASEGGQPPKRKAAKGAAPAGKGKGKGGKQAKVAA